MCLIHQPGVCQVYQPVFVLFSQMFVKCISEVFVACLYQGSAKYVHQNDQLFVECIIKVLGASVRCLFSASTKYLLSASARCLLSVSDSIGHSMSLTERLHIWLAEWTRQGRQPPPSMMGQVPILGDRYNLDGQVEVGCLSDCLSLCPCLLVGLSCQSVIVYICWFVCLPHLWGVVTVCDAAENIYWSRGRVTCFQCDYDLFSLKALSAWPLNWAWYVQS